MQLAQWLRKMKLSFLEQLLGSGLLKDIDRYRARADVYMPGDAASQGRLPAAYRKLQ